MTATKKILFVAGDVGPGTVFEQIVDAVNTPHSGVTARLYHNGGRPFSDDMITDVVSGAGSGNLVIIGSSSLPNTQIGEIAACQAALAANVPLGIFAYTPDEAARKPFREFAKQVALAFGMMPEWARKYYSRAHFVNTGNPVRETMHILAMSRAEARRKIGGKPEDTIVHVAGRKSITDNIAILALVTQALHNDGKNKKYLVVFTPHPGDPFLRAVDGNDTNVSLNPYITFVENSPVRYRYIPKSEMSSSDVLCGVDILIEYTGTTTFTACYSRIPVITIRFAHTEKGYLREVGLSGEKDWNLEHVASGATTDYRPETATAHNLGFLIKQHTSGENPLRSAQEYAYPILRQGTSMRKILVAIRHTLDQN